MRIITINTNGIRSAQRKGFFEWLATQDADIVCVQETKAQIHQLTAPVFFPEGYHCHYYDAERKGYSGTAMYLRHEPEALHLGLGWDPADSEGRVIRADYKDLSVVCLYLPSGSSGDAAQAKKYDFMDSFFEALRALRAEQREVIVCADWNIAHQPIDLKNWRSNQKNSGFLPDERAWLDRVYDELGYIDAFRLINQEPEQYTWWSNRGQAWAKNVGWRLDYQLITPGLREAVKAASIFKEERFSDHAPLIMDYDWPLP
ncbi:MAG: exodeoxyribonuclease III [Spongiibacteraceae bacterium]|jgi:exodeoxyribonuclease-3|nr:exodeoxyribonuclease III [Spongiibacteraceae bacterium]